MAVIPARNFGKSGAGFVRLFASVKLTVALMSLTAFTVLLGAWCPQESQQGRAKVVEQFGEQVSSNLIAWGIADIYHSPWFLFLIAMLTVNIVVGSFKKVFPKLRTLNVPLPFLTNRQINELPAHFQVVLVADSRSVLSAVSKNLKSAGYRVEQRSDALTGESGKLGRLAPTVTHIGLLALLLGVTVTSWTGFSGFQPVALGEDLSFTNSEHSKLWIGKLPTWHLHVDATRRENYESGDAKQWYSDLTAIDNKGAKLKSGEISVNNPFTCEGVDVYQSSWGLDHILVSFNDRWARLNLSPMGGTYAAFMALDEATVLIFSVRSAVAPVKVFAKTAHWPEPRILTMLVQGKPVDIGSVKVELRKVVPVTGLQYKCDPGLPITFCAFAFIIAGVLLAAVPHHQVFVKCTQLGGGLTALQVGGFSRKAKRAFEQILRRILVKSCAGFDTAPTSGGDAEGIEVATTSGGETCPTSN